MVCDRIVDLLRFIGGICELPVLDQFQKTCLVVLEQNLSTACIVIRVILMVNRLILISVCIRAVAAAVRTGLSADLFKFVFVEDQLIDALVIHHITILSKARRLLQAVFYPSIVLCFTLREAGFSCIHGRISNLQRFLILYPFI